MAQTFLQTQKAHATGRHQRSGQRADRRGYPDDGVPWGQKDWGGGGTPPGPLPVTATHAKSGAPGAWHPVDSMGSATVADLIAGVPVTIIALTSGGAASGVTPWAAGQYIVTQDGGQAHWGGTAWVSGVGVVEDVLNGTIDEVKAYVNALAMDDNRDNVIQALLDAERANRNRATLVSWLDQQTGVE
jgi:hypothetical protein